MSRMSLPPYGSTRGNSNNRATLMSPRRAGCLRRMRSQSLGSEIKDWKLRPACANCANGDPDASCGVFSALGESIRRPDVSRFHSARARIAWFSLLPSLLLAGTIYAADPPPDPAVTIYGTLNPAAPAELATFSFLVGKWTGTGKYRDAEGKPTDFGVLWVGRYALNGMAIADEIRRPEAEGAGISGLTLRFFDPTSKTWTVE